MTAPILKDRELEILRLLAAGKSDKQVAARLHLAPDTVRWYNKQIYGKLGVTSRDEAVQRATAMGWIEAGATAPIVRSPIRYVDSDGVSIAWQTVGQGPVDLLFMAGFVSHLDTFWENAEYTAFTESLARHARVIVFDRRGVGLSDRTRGASTLEQTMADARAVLRAANSTRAFVSGTSESGAAAVLLASMYPDLVRGLILIAATAMPARRGPEPPWSRPWEAFMAMVDTMQRTWGEPWSIERLTPSRMGEPAFASWWARALRAAASPASVRLILERTMQVDIRTLLPQVRTRTVVIHRIGDVVVPIDAGRYLARELPNATMVELPGRDHVWFVNGADIAEAMVAFIAAPDAPAEVDTRIAIVLHGRGHGADEGMDPSVRSEVDACQGRHLRRTTWGWTAVFDAPQRALRCAQRLRAAHGLVLHVGACRTADGVPVGAAHELGYRLAEQVAPGEVLVTGILRDILVGVEVTLRARSVDGGDAVTPPITVWSLDPSGDASPQ